MTNGIYYIYISASRRNGTLYIGITIDLIRRVHEHKSGYIERFTSMYGVDKLEYFEQCENFEFALQREKRLKEWKRKWKLELIEKVNPLWEDLFGKLLSDG